MIPLAPAGPNFDENNLEHVALRALASWLKIHTELPEGVRDCAAWGFSAERHAAAAAVPTHKVEAFAKSYR